MFGGVSDALIAPLVIAGGDGTACESLAPSEVRGKTVLATRGTCPMSRKALNAEEAGATAFICANSVPGDAPARMSYFGDEESLVSIPSVMISYEDGERLRAVADDTWAMEFAHTIDEGHRLRRELDLKQKIFQADLRETDVGERIMHLAEYFAQGPSPVCAARPPGRWLARSPRTSPARRLPLAVWMYTLLTTAYADRISSAGNWTTESTVLVRQAAVRSPNNPELLYGVATYFWNFRHDAATARGYHEAAASAAALQVVDPSLPATAREAAMTVVKNVVVLIPEDKPQLLVLRTFAAHSALAELKEILFFLHERRKLGSGAVLEWANRIENIGDHAMLLSVLAGFLREHPSREDDDWMSLMQEARGKVMASCAEQTELDCEWFFVSRLVVGALELHVI